MKRFLLIGSVIFSFYGNSQILLKADRLFDGTEMHSDWVLVVEDGIITFVGPKNKVPEVKFTEIHNFGDATLMPRDDRRSFARITLSL